MKKNILLTLLALQASYGVIQGVERLQGAERAEDIRFIQNNANNVDALPFPEQQKMLRIVRNLRNAHILDVPNNLGYHEPLSLYAIESLLVALGVFEAPPVRAAPVRAAPVAALAAYRIPELPEWPEDLNPVDFANSVRLYTEIRTKTIRFLADNIVAYRDAFVNVTNCMNENIFMGLFPEGEFLNCAKNMKIAHALSTGDTTNISRNHNDHELDFYYNPDRPWNIIPNDPFTAEAIVRRNALAARVLRHHEGMIQPRVMQEEFRREEAAPVGREVVHPRIPAPEARVMPEVHREEVIRPDPAPEPRAVVYPEYIHHDPEPIAYEIHREEGIRPNFEHRVNHTIEQNPPSKIENSTMEEKTSHRTDIDNPYGKDSLPTQDIHKKIEESKYLDGQLKNLAQKDEIEKTEWQKFIYDVRLSDLSLNKQKEILNNGSKILNDKGIAKQQIDSFLRKEESNIRKAIDKKNKFAQNYYVSAHKRRAVLSKSGLDKTTFCNLLSQLNFEREKIQSIDVFLQGEHLRLQGKDNTVIEKGIKTNPELIDARKSFFAGLSLVKENKDKLKISGTKAPILREIDIKKESHILHKIKAWTKTTSFFSSASSREDVKKTSNDIARVLGIKKFDIEKIFEKELKEIYKNDILYKNMFYKDPDFNQKIPRIIANSLNSVITVGGLSKTNPIRKNNRYTKFNAFLTKKPNQVVFKKWVLAMVECFDPYWTERDKERALEGIQRVSKGKLSSKNSLENTMLAQGE